LALFIFKYYNFFTNNFIGIASFLHLHYPLKVLNIILPIGLSFHTFQSLSYVIEVYKGKQKAEHHLGIYALYVMFYPQLVAGPIERPQHLLHQFHEKHTFDYARVVDGLKHMLWGYFKKLVIADRLAIYVSAVYGNISHHGGPTLLLATVFFAFQIYCDFSGYSDIAIGAAKVMGFDLMTNFKRPYFAQSISEFWKRWHISLSTWFRDYLYIPLGGNRVPVSRWYVNILIVFAVSGLWHGAKWTFFIWGMLHGAYFIAAAVFSKSWARRPGLLMLDMAQRLMDFLKIITVFIFVTFAWIFFRANTISDAFLIVKKILIFKAPLFIPEVPLMVFSFFGILFLLFVEFKEEFFPDTHLFINSPQILVRQVSYALLILTILLIGVFDGSQFIYFQF
jgi:D-alanyl-lipoteichoic acid acyltransferase DltB (MBOAT superfamily)